jgi:citrate synthase
MSTTVVAPKGLEGIVATTSSICWIDGDAGVLSYRGIDIHELAAHSTFEETTYLLWEGKLPTAAELTKFSVELAAARALAPEVITLLHTVPKTAKPMEVLRTALSMLSMYDADENDSSREANLRKSFRLTAQTAMIVALFDRIRKGLPTVDADPSHGHRAHSARRP